MNSPHEHQNLKDYLIMDYRNSKDRLDELLSSISKPSLGAILREVSHQIYLLNQHGDQKPDVNYPNAVTVKIASLLEAHSLEFIRVSHPPSRTSAECFEARRASGKEAEGAKAILIRVTGQEKDVSFALCVLPGRRQINSKLLKNKLGVKKISFASYEELHGLTGMILGTMPPFIAPVFPKLKSFTLMRQFYQKNGLVSTLVV
jgi:prolyl-tRNA editing enzyme YbaK/EbsC (Cys-tRNA(Pro) deacylase)